MPNHLHGVVWIADMGTETDDGVGAHNDGTHSLGAHGRAPLRRKPRSLGSLVAGFKSAATGRANAWRASPGIPLWQRNYYERVIRNEKELSAIRRYICDNPLKWSLDRDNPANGRPLAGSAHDYLAELPA